MNILLQQIETPEITDVNGLLTWLLGIFVVVIGYLYRESRKDNKELNDKIKQVYEAHKDDLRLFSEEKTKSVVDVTNALNKVILLIEQLKDLSNGK